MSANIEIGTLIDRDLAIRGGRPKIAGTGLTVARIVGWYKTGLTPEEIALEYPHLTLAQVHAALAYYQPRGRLSIILALVAAAVPAAGSGPCAAQVGGGAVQTLDSWVVTGDQTVDNKTIHLKGPLRVLKGTLTLKGVALEIDSTQPASLFPDSVVAIQVQQDTGGSLAISGWRITPVGACRSFLLLPDGVQTRRSPSRVR